MNTEIQTKTFVLTGPLARQTIQINGRWFVEGRCTVTAPAHLMGGAELYLGTYYQAYPEGSAALLAAQAKESSSGKRDLPSGGESGEAAAPVLGGVQPGGQGPGPEAADASGVDAGASTGPAGSVASGNGQSGPASEVRDQMNRLRSALEQLDPAADEHWTADGKPSVDVVTKLAGFPVTRQEIEAADPDMMRPEPSGKSKK